jgi:hypothetical protein
LTSFTLASAAASADFFLRQLNFVIARIDLRQDVAGFDRLIVINENFFNLAGHLRRNRNNVAIEERVVGGLVGEAGPEVMQSEEKKSGQRERAGDDRRQPFPARRFLPVGPGRCGRGGRGRLLRFVHSPASLIPSAAGARPPETNVSKRRPSAI